MNWYELVMNWKERHPLIYIVIIKIHVMHAISFEDPLIYDISIRKQIHTFGDKTHPQMIPWNMLAIISYQSQSTNLYAKKCLIGIANSYEWVADKIFRTFYVLSFDCIKCSITLYGVDVASFIRRPIHLVTWIEWACYYVRNCNIMWTLTKSNQCLTQ